MEKKHLRRIQEKFGRSAADKKIICLNIPDEYQYMDEDLIGILMSSVSMYIELPDSLTDL